MVLHLKKEQLAQIHAHARDSYPLECCGILVGKTLPGQDSREVKRVVEAGNLNTERAKDRYLLDPMVQLKAEKAARLEGLEVLGYYHSHPDHPFFPSQTDLEQSWQGYSYLIVKVSGGRELDQRCWRRAEGEKLEFIEEGIRVE